MTGPNDRFEVAAGRDRGLNICGIDEAGRGPLAGPVVAAAVMLDWTRVPDGLADSKKLNASRRDELRQALENNAMVGVGLASVEEIDRLNILQASLLAMRRAFDDLPIRPDHALVDGNKLPDLTCPAAAIVKGDDRVLSIAAASIVAKEVRDAIMRGLAEEHPGYGWETNMGYGTKAHRQALIELGVTAHHRRGFGPVRRLLQEPLML